MKTYREIKLIWNLAFPMILGSLAQLFFGLGDQAILGRVNVDGYAAVGVVANSLYVLTGSLGIFGVVFNILGSKALGEKNESAFGKYFNASITVSLIIGAAFYIIILLFGNLFLSKFFALEGDVLKYGLEYLYITGISLGLNSIIFVFCSYFKNIQKTKIILWATLIPGVVNLGIDYVLVFGKFGMPRLEVSGAAIGSVIGLFLAIGMFTVEFMKTRKFKFKLTLSKKIIKEFSSIYFPMAGQDFLEYTIFSLVLTAVVTRIGTYYLASYNLLSALMNILILPVYAFAGASLTIVAKSVGEKNTLRQNSTPIYSTLMAYLFFVILSGIILFFPEITTSLITDDKDIINLATSFLAMALFSQVLNITNQVFKNSLFAIGEEKWALYYSIISSAVGLGVVYVMVINLKQGLNGIYIALFLYYLILSVGYVVKYYFGDILRVSLKTDRLRLFARVLKIN